MHGLITFLKKPSHLKNEKKTGNTTSFHVYRFSPNYALRACYLGELIFSKNNYGRNATDIFVGYTGKKNAEEEIRTPVGLLPRDFQSRAVPGCATSAENRV